jgi:acetyl esterase/lipase
MCVVLFHFTNRKFCSLIAARTKCLVFDADYRKAPEHPFSAAIQDAEDIAYYLIANLDKYDPSNIFISGFSAGGSIAIVTASTLGQTVSKESSDFTLL